MNDEGKSHQKSFRKKVEFNPQVYTILVSPASEYRDWGIWHDVWYDEEDYSLIRTDGTIEPLSSDKFEISFSAL